MHILTKPKLPVPVCERAGENALMMTHIGGGGRGLQVWPGKQMLPAGDEKSIAQGKRWLHSRGRRQCT